MAEDLMRNRVRARALAGQQGFSMIEMLMTSFILAIGLLGLCMLQTMSLRASRGNTSLATAVKVAEGVMDEVELQGRLSWLNISDSTYTGMAVPAANMNYINITAGQGLPANGQLQFNIQGDPVAGTGFFSVNVIHTDEVGTNGTGSLGDFNVVATFNDTATTGGVAVPRSVSITRRIAHG